jgi:hypothetical protein
MDNVGIPIYGHLVYFAPLGKIYGYSVHIFLVVFGMLYHEKSGIPDSETLKKLDAPQCRFPGASSGTSRRRPAGRRPLVILEAVLMNRPRWRPSRRPWPRWPRRTRGPCPADKSG